MVRAYRTVRVAVPDTPAPEPGDESWEAFAQLSQRFQEHTALELEKENRLQASEKVWASVGYALTAVAKQRGWKHDSYAMKYQISQQIGIELADAASSLDPSPRTRAAMLEYREKEVSKTTNGFDTAKVLHDNFRANTIDMPDIKRRRAEAAKFLEELDKVLEDDGEFTPINRADQWRLARLSGLYDEANRIKRESGQKAMEAYLDDHFPLYKKIEWRRNAGDGDGSGGGVPNPDTPPDGGQDGGAIINGGGGLNLQRRENPDPPDKPAKPVASGGRSYPKRTEPKAPAQCKVAAGPAKERRRVIAPRPTARR